MTPNDTKNHSEHYETNTSESMNPTFQPLSLYGQPFFWPEIISKEVTWITQTLGVQTLTLNTI